MTNNNEEEKKVEQVVPPVDGGPNGLTPEEEKKLFLGIMKSHTHLVKWLYDNHLDILREYEALQGNLRIHFLEDIWKK
jgi:hypothetical protein